MCYSNNKEIIIMEFSKCIIILSRFVMFIICLKYTQNCLTTIIKRKK